ncbi:MAG: hypothetical protein V4733_06750 [Verrucomicrobiota bacterium]
MFRTIFAKLKGLPPDPTADWPRLSPPAPAIEHDGAIGNLRFGDDLTAAQSFGRPEHFHWMRPDYCQLLYAGQGFQLEFDAGRFAYAAFLVGPDEFLPDSQSLVFSTPRVDSHVLSRATTVQQIETMFGPPDSADRDDEETVLAYRGRNVTLEFEFAATEMLKRVNAYSASAA